MEHTETRTFPPIRLEAIDEPDGTSYVWERHARNHTSEAWKSWGGACSRGLRQVGDETVACQGRPNATALLSQPGDRSRARSHRQVTGRPRMHSRRAFPEPSTSRRVADRRFAVARPAEWGCAAHEDATARIRHRGSPYGPELFPLVRPVGADTVALQHAAKGRGRSAPSERLLASPPAARPQAR